ncbi:MAG: alpha/beta fold hydrolase [Woeseiaceae bacterium]|nr:alpha/beta fold hydrolase [Woeseiaceae bacterium]
MAAEHLLLLPGMMCDERLWGPQAEALPQAITHADTTSADNFDDMARAVLAEAPERFALAGLSMGGILAFEIWRQAPERVTHMALLDTNPHAEKPERQATRLEQIHTALAGGLRELATESLKPLYLAESNRDDEELLDTILDMALDLGPEVFRRQSLALRDRVDSVPTLLTIHCPTLVLCGSEDRLCPPAYHELMAERIPDARLAIVADCGHLSTLEQPGRVTHELETLLAS